jgi:putative flavoprotein involved in K+ transport
VSAERHGAVIVGAGAAGLGVAAELTRRKVELLLLEREEKVGASWRARYPTLRLNNDRWSSRLPRSSIPRRAGRWPARDEFIAYLEGYARRFDIRFGVDVQRIDPLGGDWLVRTSDGMFAARSVVVCTGHDRLCSIPAWPGIERFGGELVHSSAFQEASEFAGEDVLVVGIGTSATEIAVRLPPGGARRVRMAARTTPNLMPAEFLGLPITAWARVLQPAPQRLVDTLARIVQRRARTDLAGYGLSPAPYGVATELARKGMGPVIDRGFTAALKAGEVELVEAVEGFEGGSVCLRDGTRIQPDVVIAATGYRTGLEQLVGHLGVLDASGLPRNPVARTQPARGLFFNGYWIPLSGELPGMRQGARAIAREIARRERGGAWAPSRLVPR